MKYLVLFKPTAVKDLQRLPVTVQKRIKIKLEFYLTQDQPLDFAVKLIGNGKAGEYRFRVGDYRIVFDADDARLVILSIEHRREVYRTR